MRLKFKGIEIDDVNPSEAIQLIHNFSKRQNSVIITGQEKKPIIKNTWLKSEIYSILNFQQSKTPVKEIEKATDLRNHSPRSIENMYYKLATLKNLSKNISIWVKDYIKQK